MSRYSDALRYTVGYYGAVAGRTSAPSVERFVKGSESGIGRRFRNTPPGATMLQRTQVSGLGDLSLSLPGEAPVTNVEEMPQVYAAVQGSAQPSVIPPVPWWAWVLGAIGLFLIFAPRASQGIRDSSARAAALKAKRLHLTDDERAALARMYAQKRRRKSRRAA